MNIHKLKLYLKQCVFIRFLAYPVETFNRKILYRKFLKSDDSKYIKSLKDIHKNETCFIIGNGPSLVPEDLDKIKGYPSFAANKIYYIFSRTSWRPTYYMCVDNIGLSAEIKSIKKSGNFVKFLNYKGKKFGRTDSDKISYVYVYGKFSLKPCSLTISSLSSDVSRFLSPVGTVTVNEIEMAIYMGFKTIYLLGVDNNYRKKVSKNGKVFNDDTVKSSYFNGLEDSYGISGQNVEYMNSSYALVKEFAENNNVKIYNATRGGKLEVFERVDFDSLFPNGSQEVH